LCEGKGYLTQVGTKTQSSGNVFLSMKEPGKWQQIVVLMSPSKSTPRVTYEFRLATIRGAPSLKTSHVSSALIH
jgi:hypothetical protein